MVTVILQSEKPILIGAIHLPRLTTVDLADVNTLRGLESFVCQNAAIFEEGGFDGVFIQDQTLGEPSFLSVALTAVLARKAVESVDDMEIGIIMDSDNPEATLACAVASGASFVRLKVFVGAMVKPQGLVQGVGYRAVTERAKLQASTTILADVYDRTVSPLGDLPIELAAKQCVSIGADGLILTGKTIEETLSLVDRVRAVITNVPILVGGGVDEETIEAVLDRADGAIISSSLKSDTDPSVWDVNKIRRLVKLAKEY